LGEVDDGRLVALLGRLDQRTGTGELDVVTMRGNGEEIDGGHGANNISGAAPIILNAMLTALTRKPSRLLQSGERTHVGRDPIDVSHALAQHDEYRATLAMCGLDVHRLDDADTFPDGVFVEDTAVVVDEVAVITRPGAHSRRPEVGGIELALRAYRITERVAAPATLDGGDVVVIGKTIMVGRSERTNEDGVRALAGITRPFGYGVVPVRMRGCLHLKSGCTALPDGRLLLNRAWIEVQDLAGFELVDVASDEPWGGDVAIANDTVIAASMYPKTIAILEREGFAVKAVDVSEFAKAEGGVTCMSLIFRA
jgi:dimethylargininase